MKVPSPKPFNCSYDAMCRPELLTKNRKALQENWDRAFGKKPTALPGHTRYIYRDGKRIEVRNPSTNPDEKPDSPPSVH